MLRLAQLFSGEFAGAGIGEDLRCTGQMISHLF